jgi:ABC-2 type transport system permease protein
MRLSLRNPVWVIIGLTQPILYLALFGPLLERMDGVPGWPAGDAWQVFVPGLLVQLGIFGAAFVGFGLIGELRAGVVERERVTPAARGALLMGRVLRDVVVLLVQGLLLVGTATVFGLSAPLGGLLLGVVVVALLGAAFSAASYAAALTLKSEDALAPLLNSLAVPLLLLSGILLPMTLAPGWLETASDANAVKHVVDGVRALFLGDVADSAVLWGLVAVLGLAAAGIALGTRTFQRESG